MTYTLTRRMMASNMLESLFDDTIKLVSVAPNILSNIEDHFGCKRVTWFPIGPTGGDEKDFSF